VIRVVLLLLLLFGIALAARLALGFVRGVLAILNPPGRSARSAPRELGEPQEMVRDPVCGAWIDRRIARGGLYCSDACRRVSESRAGRS
jgi:hypothetical protein